jgi:hypothetical protein
MKYKIQLELRVLNLYALCLSFADSKRDSLVFYLDGSKSDSEFL